MKYLFIPNMRTQRKQKLYRMLFSLCVSTSERVCRFLIRLWFDLCHFSPITNSFVYFIIYIHLSSLCSNIRMFKWQTASNQHKFEICHSIRWNVNQKLIFLLDSLKWRIFTHTAVYSTFDYSRALDPTTWLHIKMTIFAVAIRKFQI